MVQWKLFQVTPVRNGVLSKLDNLWFWKAAISGRVDLEASKQHHLFSFINTYKMTYHLMEVSIRGFELPPKPSHFVARGKMCNRTFSHINIPQRKFLYFQYLKVKRWEGVVMGHPEYFYLTLIGLFMYSLFPTDNMNLLEVTYTCLVTLNMVDKT